MNDTGDVAEVEEEDRLDEDTLDSVSLEGGDDTEGLEEIYANPGELVEEDLA